MIWDMRCFTWVIFFVHYIGYVSILISMENGTSLLAACKYPTVTQLTTCMANTKVDQYLRVTRVTI